jgi:hypothetical protein
MDTKKILLYGGGALVLGAVGFFVWSFFQKVDLPVSNADLPISDNNNTDETINPYGTGSNPFSTANTTFDPITTPNLQSDLDWLMQNPSRP